MTKIDPKILFYYYFCYLKKNYFPYFLPFQNNFLYFNLLLNIQNTQRRLYLTGVILNLALTLNEDYKSF